ncbi:MAG TPA: hypothetical protein VGH85_10290 [Mycobacteriales bacterium]
MRKLLVVLAACAAAAFVAPQQALAADPVDTAASALQSTNVYVAPGSTVKLDKGKVQQAIGNHRLYVAVLPASAGDPSTAADTIGSALGRGRITVAVLSGTTLAARSGAFCPGAAADAARKASAAHPVSAGGDATTMFTSLVSDLGNEPLCGSGSGAAAGGSNGGGGHTGLIVGLVILALVVGGTGYWLFTRRRARRQRLEGRRAEVLSLYGRLGADVANLDAGTDAVARQAIADASERYTATGSLLEHADTDGEYDAARRTSLEGLQAARTARSRLGLDPGPDLPPMTPTTGERLTEESEVTVGDKTVRGYPDYTPGAPYYFGGGGGYGAGWYSFPFWETLLIGSALGGWGGGWGGGGYDAGYNQGYDAGQDQNDGNGGDWGGGNGGDWGGGGGDWGGGGGGGDWGGGGGGDGGGGW